VASSSVTELKALKILVLLLFLMSSILEHRAEREEGGGRERERERERGRERDRDRDRDRDRQRQTERKESRPTLNKPHQELC
jgi:Ni/Co efflux regulator RcnB